jgi:hypothetical protein
MLELQSITRLHIMDAKLPETCDFVSRSSGRCRPRQHDHPLVIKRCSTSVSASHILLGAAGDRSPP